MQGMAHRSGPRVMRRRRCPDRVATPACPVPLVFYNVLDTAATGKRRLLAGNPRAPRRWKPPEVGDKVDQRAVINPRLAREFLIALSHVAGRGRDWGCRVESLWAEELQGLPGCSTNYAAAHATLTHRAVARTRSGARCQAGES
jgi:hypothetical protein